MSPFASWLQTRVEAKLQAGATSVESVGCFRSDETCAYFITLAVGIAPLPASVLVVLTSQSGMDDSASSAVSDAAEASGASVLPDADSLLAAISAGDLGLVTECLTRSPIVASEHFRAAAQVPIPSAEIYEALLHASEAQGRTDMARYDLAVNAALAAGSFHEASRLLTFCTALDCELVHWCFSKVAASPGGAESVLQLHKSAYDKEVFVVRLAIAADSAALLSSVLTEESSANTWPAALVALASAASGPELQITACLNQITDLIKCHR